MGYKLRMILWSYPVDQLIFEKTASTNQSHLHFDESNFSVRNSRLFDGFIFTASQNNTKPTFFLFLGFIENLLRCVLRYWRVKGYYYTVSCTDCALRLRPTVFFLAGHTRQTAAKNLYCVPRMLFSGMWTGALWWVAVLGSVLPRAEHSYII